MKVYQDELITLLRGDTFEYLRRIPDSSIDLIIADPPYFLSNGGQTNSGGKWVSVNKGQWDMASKEEAEQFYKRFIEETYRILKSDGTIWIFGTFHNIYTVGYYLDHNNFKILNNVTWQKSNPAPNLSHRMLTHSTETIIWAKKHDGRHVFNYGQLKEENNLKEVTDVWTTPTTSRNEKRFGRHPTQKPLAVMKRIIQASSTQGSLILDPFVGSGTSAVAGKILNRKVICIDKSKEFLDLAQQRVLDYKNEIDDGIG